MFYRRWIWVELLCFLYVSSLYHLFCFHVFNFGVEDPRVSPILHPLPIKYWRKGIIWNPVPRKTTRLRRTTCHVCDRSISLSFAFSRSHLFYSVVFLTRGHSSPRVISPRVHSLSQFLCDHPKTVIRKIFETLWNRSWTLITLPCPICHPLVRKPSCKICSCLQQSKR